MPSVVFGIIRVLNYGSNSINNCIRSVYKVELQFVSRLLCSTLVGPAPFQMPPATRSPRSLFILGFCEILQQRMQTEA